LETAPHATQSLTPILATTLMAMLRQATRLVGDATIETLRQAAWRTKHGRKDTKESKESEETEEDEYDDMCYSLDSLVSLDSFLVRLAIAADWLTTPGGAEQVIHECTVLYPEAPLFTTIARDDFFPPSAHKTVRRSWLQALYALVPKHQALLSWMPRAIEDLDLRGYDVVLSSSHAVGKGIVPPSTALHVCYCHTPMRYAWEMEDDYLRDFRVPKFLHRYIKRRLRDLRRWDLTTAKRVDLFFANSTTTQERISRIYARDSIVIPPPVADRFFQMPLRQVERHRSEYSSTRVLEYPSYFFAAGRFVPYKRFDLLIQLANELNLPLKIAGKGQETERLKAMAGPTVEFLGFVPDADLPKLFAEAEGFFFPQFEDAGITLLEAQACGTPAIAFHAGGARDAVIDGKTGVFFEEQNVESLKNAVERFRTIEWDRAAIREHAKPFSCHGFRERIRTEITKAYEMRHSPSAS
jgi:glycosyltransferase involved in cell wall biosynthesis